MNKTIAMMIKETKTKLANVCNESGLSPVILDLIIQGIYYEIHSISERQTSEDEANYVKAANSSNKKDDTDNR